METITAQSIVEQARTWLGTKYHHQGRLKGVGVDCIGFIVGVGAELGIDGYDREEWRRYPRVPRDDGILRALRDFCGEPIKTWRPGDILCFWIQERLKRPQHVGIATDVGIIHTHAVAGKVVEHGLDGWWLSRMLGAFRFPGVE